MTIKIKKYFKKHLFYDIITNQFITYEEVSFIILFGVKYMNTYRYSIGLGDKYRFGTEIEFSNARLKRLEEDFSKEKLPVKYIFGHKILHPDYSIWYLDDDITVSEYIEGEFYGGELSSRILSDQKEYWIELRDICNILRNNDAIINETCSNHITVDLSNLKNENKFFEIFVKLIALYESEIEMFYMGDKYIKRTTKSNYARSLSFPLQRKINSIHFEQPDFLYQLKYNGIQCFKQRDAINLDFYVNSAYKTGKTIEIRYPNGTINEKTIQNNINFSLKLIDAIVREAFDREKLSNEISQVIEKGVFYGSIKEPNMCDFENIVKVIATSYEDYNDFMNQYEQVIKTKKLK